MAPLLLNSSNLMWANKIFLPKIIYEDIINGKIHVQERNNKNMLDTIKVFIDRLIEENIVYLVDLSGYLKEVDFKIKSEMYSDINNMYASGVGKPPKNPKDGVIEILFLDENSYCYPNILTIYHKMVMSRIYDAICFYDDYELSYCEKLFQIKNKNTMISEKILQNVFEMVIPNPNILTHYSFGSNDHDCFMCMHIDKCKKTYSIEINKNIDKVLDIKKSDEMIQLKEIITSIINSLKKSDREYDELDILKELYEKKRIVEKKLKMYFSKIEKWSRTIAYASAPACLIGNYFDPLIAGLGVSGIAISQLAPNIKESIKKRNNWVSLVTKNISIP